METRHLTRLIVVLLLVCAVAGVRSPAWAGIGSGLSTDANGAPTTVPTYYANSPILRKFVDTLPGVPGVTPFGANNLGQYMPAGVPEKWVNPNGVTTGDDYYEIGIVEYTERLHSDLPKATTLRGYVQLETPGLLAAGKSKHVALKYPNGTAIKNKAGQQVYAVDIPHYLGPLIIATRHTAVRIKYTNYLPKGHFDATTGQRNGDLFLPVDETLMGAGVGPDGTHKYTQNGAEIHLHGGDNPWISDGTPHQWTVPVGETGATWKTGAGFVNVPDMPDPGQGSGTLYYPNGDSARLMFYHDHTLGFTRLNVYAGEAAGYLLTDEPGTGENRLPLPTAQIPIIIQEKTFVPTDIAVQDAKWDTTHWGQPGDLWFPHVYEANQDPNSWDGTNPVGRWDYGPWFWPVFPAPEALPTGEYGNVSTTPEAFGDTPVINGTAYPSLTVDPKAYRLRILNASNDRMFNLGLYVADPAQVAADGRTNTEVKMVPATPPAPGVGLQACAAGAPVNPATGLPDNCWPATWPTDGRDGGVPDPTTAGPKMIQIGTEGGLSPQAAVIPSNPTNFEYFRRSVTVLNVSDHGLFLGNAERADVVVDFSQYAGKTLILYNDAPAPVPAFDPRIDYYTGNPDQTDSGGWYSTLIGMGPNTRTLMQIKVTGTPGSNGLPYDDQGLIAALPAVFAETQPKPVVAESAFNAALGTSYKDKYARIFTGSATQHTFDFIAGDTISYTPEGASAPISVSAGQLAQIPVQNKAIQELFDPHGRMNATLGVEIPFTGANIQTTVPYGYIDPATETIADGETQIWKITHNGVDTHPVHFHLVNVQLINRVGWDGTVKPPNENEVGWKETVRMNPLEDVIVAVRAKKPVLPGFGLPHSVRYLDPTQPPGATMNFSNLDPLTGNPFPAGSGVTNQQMDFGWEYVWHCHILGHEENDFMRPFVFKVTDTKPLAPSNLVQAKIQGTQVVLNWIDNSSDETGFRLERATVTNGVTGAFSTKTNLLANATTYTDKTTVANRKYAYRVVAFNVAGDSAPSNVAESTIPNALVAPAWISVPVTQSVTNIQVSWDTSTVTGGTYVVQESTTGDFSTITSQQTTTASSCVFAGHVNGTYFYRVKATKLGLLDSAWTNGNTGCEVVLAAVRPPTTVWVRTLAVNGQTRVTYVASTTIGASYVVEESTDPNFSTSATSQVYSGSLLDVSFNGRLNGTYYYRVKAVMAPYPDSAWANGPNGCVVLNPPVAQPTTVWVRSFSNTGQSRITYVASTTVGASYVIEESTDPTFTTTTQVYSGPLLDVTLSGKVNGTYFYRVKAVKAGLTDSAWVNGPNGCVVQSLPISPPSTVWVRSASNNGQTRVTYVASKTAGASYVIEESTDPSFAPVATTQVYSGPLLDVSFNGRQPGTYYYRVKATLTGFTDSVWVSGPNGCVVN